MSILGSIFSRFRRAPAQAEPKESMRDKQFAAAICAPSAKDRVEGQYDAAQTTRFNQKYWAVAGSKDADAETPLGVRKLLRNRGRYEIRNNSYAEGMIDTKANYIIGTGPRLQILGQSDNTVEDAYQAWAEQVNFGGKLKIADRGLSEAGESFLVLNNNKNLEGPVKLDVAVVECDRVTSPTAKALVTSTKYYDGITYDETGTPVMYDISKRHPGSTFLIPGALFDEVNARNVIHLFHQKRAGQRRGVPDITPALALFAQMRRYRAATVDAAETAADFAAVLVSNGVVDEPAEVDALDIVDIERKVMSVMPEGWDMKQFKAEHPNATHTDFMRILVNEIARCLNMPLNIALMDSSGYNYASGRLDHQAFFKAVGIEQAYYARVAASRIFRAWWNEAVRVPGFLRPRNIIQLPLPAPAHRWFWDGIEHVDPQREAKAQAIRLSNNTTNLANEYAKQGKDWQKELEQTAVEERMKKDLGITTEEPTDTEGNADASSELAEIRETLDELRDSVAAIHQGRRTA